MAHRRFSSTDISDEDIVGLKETANALKADVLTALSGTVVEDQVAGFFELLLDALSRKKSIGDIRNNLVQIFRKISEMSGEGKLPEDQGAALRDRISAFLKDVTAASGRKMYDHEEYLRKLKERKKKLSKQGRSASAALCEKASHICSRLVRIRRIMETVL